MKKVKIGIVGCNYMGKMHADCYRQMKNVEVIAVADINFELAASLAKVFDAKVYLDGFAMIEECELDILDICLPTFLHAEYALKAMERVPYILIEKPVTLTVEEGEQLLAKQAQTHAEIGVGHVLRFWEEYEYLKSAIDEKRYGKLINLTLRRVSPSPSWDWNSWRQDGKLSGGAILDLHIHDVDYMLYALGEPKQVYSVKNVLGEKNSYVATICAYEDFTVNIEGTWYLPQTYPFNMYYRAVFEKAVLEFDRDKLTIYESKNSYAAEVNEGQMRGNVKYGNISSLGGYFNELKYFVGQAQQEKPIERATLLESVNSLRFLIKHCY